MTGQHRQQVETDQYIRWVVDRSCTAGQSVFQLRHFSISPMVAHACHHLLGYSQALSNFFLLAHGQVEPCVLQMGVG